MEMHSLVDILLGLVIMGGGWWAKECHAEMKRVQILLNKTREEYATKAELRDDMQRVMEALHRLEDKLDRVLSR
jgi:uncharacterized protein (DUF1786 family)